MMCFVFQMLCLGCICDGCTGSNLLWEGTEGCFLWAFPIEKGLNKLRARWRHQNLNKNDYYAKRLRGFNRIPIFYP